MAKAFDWTRTGRSLAVCATLVLGGAGGALAQAGQPGPTLPNAAPPETTGQGTLSEKLNRTNGVIPPPGNVDPDIHVTPPDPGPNTMPVVPPPGTPGGNQQVQPK